MCFQRWRFFLFFFSPFAPGLSLWLCSCVLLSRLRLQHAPQQQQLLNNRWQEPRRRRGKARKYEEVGHQHLQGKAFFPLNSGIIKSAVRGRSVLSATVCVLVAVVYKTNDLRALRPGFPDRGPGAGGPDRGAARHQEEIWERAAVSQSADQPLLQHGADAARAGWHLRWPESEITRTTGEAPTGY